MKGGRVVGFEIAGAGDAEDVAGRLAWHAFTQEGGHLTLDPSPDTHDSGHYVILHLGATRVEHTARRTKDVRKLPL